MSYSFSILFSVHSLGAAAAAGRVAVQVRGVHGVGAAPPGRAGGASAERGVERKGVGGGSRGPSAAVFVTGRPVTQTLEGPFSAVSKLIFVTNAYFAAYS